MRRFSSEGSLLDLDFLPWKKVELKNPDYEKNQGCGTYTPHIAEDKLGGILAVPTPTIQEPRASPGEVGKKQLAKEHSVSAENLSELGKLEKSHLGVCLINEGCRAYSDGQLAPAAQGSMENVARDDQTPRSPSSSSSHHFLFKSQHTHQKPRLSSAKLHLKSLFGQSPHSSNSNLLNTEPNNSATHRRSRLLFMRQWSQVGHSKKRKISREDLEKWAESLNALLASQTGVSVFGAFLRSEFSEENLQFYLACEQYRHSSNNFSLQRRAKDICATYIQPGAPREVNLDSKTRDLTVQLLQAPSHTSLSHAQKRIYSLLDTDCYPRFLQSSVYLSLLQDAD
ncbi:regulator of G-protein signaling 8 isoform X1 [Micropterus dolomieu]|uniref:regulator of G-protein signaling 8 isoform X1 n=1 Tax=Micropterus dolomieu TaxID=147949 RepID=UPI001E8DF913|nr:regulator of G-protein signaling 8 isoform X1 [Micropterus dolomieu]XP_045914326.1 regulator of G-protein signaling 8 isoform X1 [Micropterus dolomieu]XP_045914327.1 regulator of G-protein signaling 8 isoform X1 [Micropterus dolomieu]